jgi:AcrR family transcriptional regulator
MGLKERRLREKEARRRQIIDAARSLLVEKGLAATSINQIAKRAELGVGTIYFYYQNKEELFAALQEEGLDLLLADIREAVADATEPPARLRAAALSYLGFSRDRQSYFDVIGYFLSSPNVLLSSDLKSRVDEKSRDFLSLIMEIISDGIAAGRFRDIDPEDAAVLFWSSLHGLLQFRKLEQTALSNRPFAERFERAVNQLIAGLEKRKV